MKSSDDLAVARLLELAKSFIDAQDYQRGLDITKSADAIARGSRNRALMAITGAHVGLAYEFAGNFEEAARCLEQAAEISDHLEQGPQLHLNQARGRVMLRLQQVETGLALTEQVINGRFRRQEYELAAITILGAGELLLEIDKDRAARWVQRWRDVCNAAGAEYELQCQRLLIDILGLGI